MGKKSSNSSSMKKSKHEKKQNLNNMMNKIQRPKVYITDPSNFKSLVQQHTGNGKYFPVSMDSSPPPPPPPTWEEEVLPFSNTDYHYHHYHHHDENYNDLSFDSSCLTTPLEGSPDLSITPISMNVRCELGDLDKQKMDFFKDLEAMLMEMDSSSNSCDFNAACYGSTFQQDQACVNYDYDHLLPTFI